MPGEESINHTEILVEISNKTWRGITESFAYTDNCVHVSIHTQCNLNVGVEDEKMQSLAAVKMPQR